MPDFEHAIRASRQAGVDFLIIDLNLAATFLHVARSSPSAATAARNLANARGVYNTVAGFQTRMPETEARVSEVAAGLSALKVQLEAMGEVFDQPLVAHAKTP